MELTAYLHPGWRPLIRPAPASRPWMDATPESFAYRCLPLNIANAHGWEVLNPHGFEAVWDGRPDTGGIAVRQDAGGEAHQAPVSLFGQGVLTFHIEAIIRTPPGWNLWIGGSPNRAKDAIAPLGGVIETDWSPFTFTMNWRFTRPGQPIRFEAMEPFCFLFPVQRSALEAFAPAFAPLDADPATAARFKAWSEARDAFHAQMAANPPKTPSARWQKHYYRGVDVTGAALVNDHRTKQRLKDFDRSAAPQAPTPPAEDAAAEPASPAPLANDEAARRIAALEQALAKREWLLEAVERHRALTPGGTIIERRADLSREAFLEQYYAPQRPVILTGEMAGWTALTRWNPGYLKAKVGSAIVEYQGGRSSNPLFELEKERHRRSGPFDAFIDTIIGGGEGNDAYLTAFNSERNREALAPLAEDLGFLDKFLTRAAPGDYGMPWIGPAGTFTALHHDLTNNFIAQIVGRKRLKLLPASEVGHLYNDRHVFSQISDLEDPGLSLERYPKLDGARLYEVVLEPGEILFVPLAWWHQVRSLKFSITMTYTNFHWPNEGYDNYS